MSLPEPTPRFQLLINGEVQATATVGDVGVLTAIVGWGRSEPPRTRVGWDRSDRLDVRLGGLNSASREFMDWRLADLKIGDEVTVRLLPPGEADPPLERREERQPWPRPNPRRRLHSRLGNANRALPHPKSGKRLRDR